MSQSIKLTDEEYQYLLKISHGMRNKSEDFVHHIALRLHPKYYNQPLDCHERYVTEDGKAAMAEYERTHNGRDGKDAG